jgi:hypothetical protein
VPQALAYVPEMRMLVQAAAPGETLDALTLRGDVGAEVRRCAAGLAKLHGSELRIVGLRISDCGSPLTIEAVYVGG